MLLHNSLPRRAKEFPYWIFLHGKFPRTTFEHCVTGRARLISNPIAGVIILEVFLHYFPLLTTRKAVPFVRQILCFSLYHKSCQLTLWELSKTSLSSHYADNPLRMFHKTPWKSIVRLFHRRKFKEKWTALGKVFPSSSLETCAFGRKLPKSSAQSTVFRARRENRRLEDS